MLRYLLSGVQWLLGQGAVYKITGKSGISQARKRLGWEAVKAIHDEVVRPIAEKQTAGAWYRSWRVVSLDGSTLGYCRQRGEPEGLWATTGEPGLQCISAAAFRGVAGEWYACPVCFSVGELRLRRVEVGGGNDAAGATGNAMFGRPWFRWRAAVETGSGRPERSCCGAANEG